MRLRQGLAVPGRLPQGAVKAAAGGGKAAAWLFNAF
jgi:hypothetical protein